MRLKFKRKERVHGYHITAAVNVLSGSEKVNGK